MADLYFTAYDDTITIETAADLEGTIFLTGGNDTLTVKTGGGDMHSGKVRGGTGNDTVSGYNIALLYGDEGNDTLYAGGEVFGGEGDDDVRSETTAHGGDGNDRVYAFFDTAYGDEGDDIVTSDSAAVGGEGNDQVSGRFWASGGAGNDVVSTSEQGEAFGDDGDDVVVGGYTASGGAGNDIVSVTATDAAWLYGGAGDDQLTGSDSRDLIIGGLGADILRGGYRFETDVFRFDPGDLGFSFATRDKIMDFRRGTDKIDLTAFENSTVSFASDSYYDRVKIDINGDQKTDFLIQVYVYNGGSLTVGDILM